MDKRGISAVVATVLIILLVVSGVGIVWLGIMPMIEGINIDKSAGLRLVSTEGHTLWDPESRLATVQIERAADGPDVYGIDIVFSFSGDSVTHFVEDVPGLNGKLVYHVNLSEYPGELDSISIVPIFWGGVAGGVASELKIDRIPEADIVEMIEEDIIVAEEFVEPTGYSGGGGGSGGSSSGGNNEETSTCNNGVIESGENCDGISLNLQNCSSQGFGLGNLSCLNDCSGYNVSGCVSCTDTCSSLGYECGFQDVCGVSTDCESCSGEDVCSIGSCIVISGDVEAVVDVFNPQGLAPYTVLFNGFESSSPGREIMDYVWDFNDQNSQYERYDTGRMVGHRFDDPGTYVVYLTATDETGASSINNISIEVLDNPVDAEVYYVANGGNDADSGLCEIDDGEGCGPWASFGRVTSDGASIPDGSEILFNRGDTFDLLVTHEELPTTSVGSLMRAAPYYITIGAYGSGDKPTLNGGLDTGFEPEGQGINIEGIHLIAAFYSQPSYPNRYPGHQGAIRDSVLDGGFTGWTTSGVSFENILVDGASGGPGPDFQDYSEFIYWNNVTILNVLGHGVYFASELLDPATPIGKILIENSEFAYNGLGDNLRDGFTIHGFTDNFIFRNNDVHDNGFAMGWDSAYNDDYVETPEFNRNFILEDSRIHDQVYSTLQFSSQQNLIIRNNIFYNNPSGVIRILTPNNYGVDDEDSFNVRIYNNILYNNYVGYQDSLFYFDADQVRDIYVYNNIVYGNSGMDYILEDRDSGDLTIRNNLYYNNAPATTDFRLDGDGYDLATWMTSGPETGIINADPLFVDAAGGDFRLQMGSPAIDSGVNVSSYFDFDGNARPQGLGWDIGAYEYF